MGERAGGEEGKGVRGGWGKRRGPDQEGMGGGGRRGGGGGGGATLEFQF